MGSPSYEIVDATPAHIEILAQLGKTTFGETFIGMAYYTKPIVEGYTDKAFAPEELARDFGDSNIQYLLLKVEGTFAGYAKLIERIPTECIRHLHAIYLERIYLSKAFQRRGLGEILLNEVKRRGVAKGYEWLWLGVWEYNKPAVAFYLKQGFQKLGEWDWAMESCGQRYVDRDWIFGVPLNQM